MRLGLFGGTFDPIHLGHLLLAETCREAAQLDRIWFIPNTRPPHKQDKTLSEANHRVQMLKLAIGGHPAFEVCTLEVDRGGLSYTVETLEQLSRSQPDDELFFLMGADTLADFPNWRAPARICELATPLIVRRPGSTDPDFAPLGEWMPSERVQEIRDHQVAMPQIDISSTDIRKRVAAQQSIRFRTPRGVEKYIESQQLYQPLGEARRT